VKCFKELIEEQASEVKLLKNVIYEITNEKIASNFAILGALLTGSVARGDARIGPFGIMIDLTIIVASKHDINLDVLFGTDEEPFIPYHCVSIQDKIGLAIKVLEEGELAKIRELDEPSIFALNESEILDDKKGILKKWKRESFEITEAQKKERTLNQYFRFNYMTNAYRFEKWSYRKAWTQIAQNFNEANECYCNFLYCINNMFIPRKDWLTYLTFELENKPQHHQIYMQKLYETELTEETINNKLNIYREIEEWMQSIVNEYNWL
jgi:predicted nucleotidyltransferase